MTPATWHAAPVRRPVARLLARRHQGYATVTLCRGGYLRRYHISLRRYTALRRRTMRMGCPTWRSGLWLRHGFVVHFWPNNGPEHETKA